jgi:hypothetical protein
VELPENEAPSVEFNVSPAAIVAKPDIAVCGVIASLESTATLMLPTYMEAITFEMPELLLMVSIFQPDSVCPVE